MAESLSESSNPWKSEKWNLLLKKNIETNYSKNSLGNESTLLM